MKQFNPFPRLRNPSWLGGLCLPGPGVSFFRPGRYRSRLAAALAAWLLPALAVAGEVRLGFAPSLKQVWASHPEVQQAEAALRAAGHDKFAAYTGFLPYAQVDMARSEDHDEQELRVVLPLWRGGLNLASLDVAEAGRVAAVADLQRTRLRLGLRLAEAYFSAVSAREQDGLWQHYLAVLAQLQGLIERRAAGGASPESDVQTVLTRLRQADAGAVLNRSQLAAAEAQYVSLLGAEAQPADWPAPALALRPDDLAALADPDLTQHPELAYAAARAVREAADTRRSRAQLSPEVSLRYTEPFGELADTSEPVTQVVLQYQTDNGLRAYQTYRAGQQRVTAAEAALVSARRDVTSALAVARADYAAARAQLVYQEAAAVASDAVVASALRQFEAGRKTWIEVLNAQREAHENKLQQVQQRQRLWQANARLALQGLLWERLLREAVTLPQAPASAQESGLQAADSLSAIRLPRKEISSPAAAQEALPSRQATPLPGQDESPPLPAAAEGTPP